MDKKLKVALICFDNPFLKPSEGGKKGIMTRIKSLSLLENVETDVYLMNKQHEGVVENFPSLPNIENFYQYSMNSTKKSFFGTYPISVNKRFVKDCVNDFKNEQYDIAIYEGLQVGKYRFKNSVNAKKHILYFHDIESSYRWELAKSQKNILKKLGNKFESLKFKSLEKKVNKFFDYLWFVSKDECDEFNKNYSIDSQKSIYIPIPTLKIVDSVPNGSNSKTFTYIGDLTLENNIKSLQWFVENIFIKVLKTVKDAKLKIIGKISDENKNLLQRENVEVCGYVDDIEKEYEDATSIVSPVLFGAGVKVKTIDALAHGQILITTPKGIEGTGLTKNEVIFSQNEDELVNICIELLSNREKFIQISQNGLDYIKNNHTIENQANMINETFIYLLSEKEK